MATIPIDHLLAGGRLGGGDVAAAHLTGTGVLDVPARDVDRMRSALDADARRGVILGTLHRVAAPAWPARAVAALAEGVGGPVGDHIAGNLRRLADERGEAPLGHAAKAAADGLRAARIGREKVRREAAAAIYDVGVQRLDAGLRVSRMSLGGEAR